MLLITRPSAVVVGNECHVPCFGFLCLNTSSLFLQVVVSFMCMRDESDKYCMDSVCPKSLVMKGQ